MSTERYCLRRLKTEAHENLAVVLDCSTFAGRIPGVPEKLALAKTYVYERLADGRFRPRIAKTFPFAQTVDAYRYLESNAQVGKVVITVA